jgi:hypothetical protein
MLLSLTVLAQKPRIHVFIMAGQSNMEGLAKNSDISAIYKQAQAGVIINSKNNPFNTGWGDLRPGYGASTLRFGPEVTFGYDVYSKLGGEKVGLIKYAVGGTNLYGNWRPPSSGGTTGSLYNNMINFSKTQLDELKVTYDVKVQGFCWMQGEGDTHSTIAANEYQANLSNLIKDVRNDLGLGELPFIIAKIDVQRIWRYNAIVRQAEDNVANTVNNVYIFDTKGFATDGVHYLAAGCEELGHHFAQATYSFIPVCKSITKNFLMNIGGGWQSGSSADATNITIANGMLSYTVAGSDPYITSNDNLRYCTLANPHVLVRIRNNTPGTVALLYFKTTEDPVWSGNYVSQKIQANSNTWQTYRFDLSKHADYVGALKQLRLDLPNNASTGSVDIDFIRLGEYPLPVVNAGDDKRIVLGESVTLTATGTGPFKWNNGKTTASITVKPSKTTMYTVTVTKNGQSVSDEVMVWVNAAPAVSLTAPADNATYTEMATITLRANATDADGNVERVTYFNGATKLGSWPHAPYTVRWKNVAKGTYSITAVATDNQGASTTSAARTVIVNEQPAPELTPYIQVNGGEWLQQANAALCAGGTVSFGPHPVEGSWQWTGPGEFAATTREVTISDIKTAQAGDYVATYTDNGRSNTVTYSVNVHALPQATVSVTHETSEGEGGIITLTFPDAPDRVAISFSIDAGKTYPEIPNDNSGSCQFTGLAPGEYDVRTKWGNDDCPTELGIFTVEPALATDVRRKASNAAVSSIMIDFGFMLKKVPLSGLSGSALNLTIVNPYGKLVHSETVSLNKTDNVNIRGLAQGLYLMRLRAKTGSITRKLLLQ